MLNQVSLSKEYQCIFEMIEYDSKNKTEDYTIFEYVLPDLANKSEQDAEGNTLLHHAVNHNCVKIVEYMIQYQFDSTLLNNNGQTPLDLARTKKHREIVKLLLPSSQPRDRDIEIEVEEFNFNLNKSTKIKAQTPRRRTAQEFSFLLGTLNDDMRDLPRPTQPPIQTPSEQNIAVSFEQLQEEICMAMSYYENIDDPVEYAKTHRMLTELEAMLTQASIIPSSLTIQYLMDLNTNPLLEIKGQGIPFDYAKANRQNFEERGSRIYTKLREYLLDQGRQFLSQELLATLQQEKNQQQVKTSARLKSHRLTFFDVAPPDPQALAQAHEREIEEKVENFMSKFFEVMESDLERLSTKLQNYISALDQKPNLTGIEDQILDQMKKILAADVAGEIFQIDLWFEAYYLFLKSKEKSNSVIFATIENFQEEADTIAKMFITSIYIHMDSAFSDHPEMQGAMKKDVYATLASILDGNAPDFQTFIENYSQYVNLNDEPVGFMCLNTFIHQLLHCQEMIKDLEQINNTKTLNF